MRQKTVVDWQMKESQHVSPRKEKDYAVTMLSNLKLGVKEGKASFFLAKRVKSVVGLHGHTRG